MVSIKGVRMMKKVAHSDERGFFMEVIRLDEKILKKLNQVSVSLTKPGVVKAFHWHKGQDDLFCLLEGEVVVILFDLRKRSGTYGKRMIVKMSENNKKTLFIPKGVAHGYKVIGKRAAMMLYVMDREYNRRKPDEQRIDADDDLIGAEWDRVN